MFKSPCCDKQIRFSHLPLYKEVYPKVPKGNQWATGVGIVLNEEWGVCRKCECIIKPYLE